MSDSTTYMGAWKKTLSSAAETTTLVSSTACSSLSIVSLFFKAAAYAADGVDKHTKKMNIKVIKETYTNETKKVFDELYSKISAKEIPITVNDQQWKELKEGYDFSRSGKVTRNLLKRLERVEDIDRILIILDHMKEENNWGTGFCAHLWNKFYDSKGIFQNNNLNQQSTKPSL